LPVLSRLATEYALFNGWFSSIPGPTICNHAFAHYGTSFGNVGMNPFHRQDSILSIYERMIQGGHSAKIYYYDQVAMTIGTMNLLATQPKIFGNYSQFVADCKNGTLPAYSFIEPNHYDHPGPSGGQILASDQHLDHNVQEGERFIANTYNAVRTNPDLWTTTAMLIVYDQHGGIYDHVPPPACTPDGYIASADNTGTGQPFAFDRLGVRVPSVLISPYIPRGTVVSGMEDPSNGATFEHACIPGTVTNFFLENYHTRTIRERNASNFLTPLTDQLRPDDDCWVFDL
jgi:phospholipase C